MSVRKSSQTKRQTKSLHVVDRLESLAVSWIGNQSIVFVAMCARRSVHKSGHGFEGTHVRASE